MHCLRVRSKLNTETPLTECSLLSFKLKMYRLSQSTLYSPSSKFKLFSKRFLICPYVMPKRPILPFPLLSLPSFPPSYKVSHDYSESSDSRERTELSHYARLPCELIYMRMRRRHRSVDAQWLSVWTKIFDIDTE
jgi:hypothetical protein